LSALTIADLGEEADDLPVIASEIGSSFDGALPLDHAERLVNELRGDPADRTRRVRLRVLMLARAFAAGLEADAVDMILVATLTADELTPNAAPQVAHAIGAHRAGTMDVGAACTGFLSAVSIGAGLIESGRAGNVLIVGAEILSRHLDHSDRKTAMLFGDGAGAIVLAADADGSVGPVVLASDGSAAPYILADRASGIITMDGHETFKRAPAALIDATRDVLELAGLTTDDIDLFVYHQANGRITSAVAEALDVTDGRVLDVIAEIGNTSAASLPLALAEAHQRGLLHPGARVLLGAVGAGFTWGATILEWGQA